MQTNASSVKALFSKPIRYEIPLFQRPYVWEREKQWEPLWEDVERLAEQLVEAHDDDRPLSSVEGSVPRHFLGAVVLAPVSHGAVEIERRQVIDGQQRMTTMQLLLSAIASAVADSGHGKHAARLRKLTDNDEDLVDDADHVHKVWPTSEDRDAYRAAMAGAAGGGRLQQARAWFSEQAAGWLEGHDGDSDVAAWALHTAAASRLQVVVIDLEPDDDPQVIFETLNARGTPLSAGDLCKNLLLQVVEQRGGDVETFYRRWWSAFDRDERWRGELSVGREKRPRIDVLLDYWVEKRLARPVAVHHLFAEFRALVDATEDLNDLASDLVADGDRFLALHEDGVKGFGLEVARWRRLPMGTTTPLMLWLLGRRGEVGDDQVRSAWDAIESFVVRRALLGMTAKDYNRMFCDLLRDVRRNESAEVGDAVRDWLADQEAPSRRWPDDLDLHDAQDRPMYGRVNRGVLSMVMVELENQLRPGWAEEPLSYDTKVTLEHLLPRKWRADDWPLPDTDDPRFAKLEEDWRHELIDTLGNLTIVTGKLNSSLSNGAWKDKREGLDKGSVLHLNRGLVKIDEWSAILINARCRDVIDQVVERWPRPETGR